MKDEEGKDGIAQAMAPSKKSGTTPQLNLAPGSLSNSAIQVGPYASQDLRQTSTRRTKPTIFKLGRPSLLDLPIPPVIRYLERWFKQFVPLLVGWAGSQRDPFGTNNRIDCAVTSVWKHVYPDILINDREMDIVVALVSYNSRCR